jgi:hypothetical protein
MRKLQVLSILIAVFILISHAGAGEYVIDRDTYHDKLAGGWIGQIVGVTWGYPTEFLYLGQMIPEDKVPQWKPETINEGFGQDDIYVEMTFLKTLEDYGFDVSIRQAGIDFANSEYGLCHANDAGRRNLRDGIAPPDCSHPRFNEHADDIDYQIEADFSGLIAPGIPSYPVEAGEKFGRLVNYGDGMYGGQWVGAMYSVAFFEDEVETVVRKGLECIPEGSQYYECISDVLRCYEKDPDDWRKAWDFINQKYHKNIDYRQFSCTVQHDFNIDAKLNGAYIAIGLLYGRGDFEDTIKISMMCGQDSDCNPSNAAGILGVIKGYDNLPDIYKQIDRQTKFLHTAYSFPELIDVCEKLAQKLVIREGGRVARSEGREKFIIPAGPVRVSKLVQSHKPEPVAGTPFTKEEMSRIKISNPEIKEKMPPAFVIGNFAPGWQVLNCGDFMLPGLYDKYDGRDSVLVTHPYNQVTPCVITRTYSVPQEAVTKLHFIAGHHYMGDYELVVKVDGRELYSKVVGPETADDRYLEAYVDLTDYSGRTIKIDILNQANGWACEAAYWDVIEIVTE